MRTIVFFPILALLCLALLFCCGPKAVHFPAPTSSEAAMHHDDYEALLGRYLSGNGDVDYGAWQESEEDVAALDRFLGRMTDAPPTVAPERFAGPQDQLSYWINLYNALVVREVVRRWPLASVRDYRPTLSSKIDTTKGFFRDLRFVVGGKEMSLDDIEHATIRSQFDDARVHFALNCGSSSCPVLRPKVYTGGELELELQSAAVAFLNAPANVSVDDKNKRIRLSKIFKWYGDDFVKHARRVTGDPKAGALDFVALFAEPKLREALRAARQADYKIAYAEYDWGVNQGVAERPKEGSPPGGTVASKATGHTLATRRDYEWGATIGALDFELLDGSRFVREGGKPLVLSIWATYCVPCRKSLPHLESLATQHAGQLQVLALSADDGREKIEDFLSSRQILLPVAFGEAVSDRMKELKVQSLPTEFFVDGEGRILFALVGAASDAQLDAAVAELLAR